jgi:hypothetical protein
LASNSSTLIALYASRTPAKNVRKFRVVARVVLGEPCAGHASVVTHGCSARVPALPAAEMGRSRVYRDG